MLVTDEGMYMDMSEEQLPKQPLPNFVTEEGMATVLTDVQYSKHCAPKLVTLYVTLLISTVSGITTSVSVPLYFVSFAVFVSLSIV